MQYGSETRVWHYYFFGAAPFMDKMAHMCKTNKINAPEGFFYHKHLLIKES